MGKAIALRADFEGAATAAARASDEEREPGAAAVGAGGDL
jgi:hypothetical protein